MFNWRQVIRAIEDATKFGMIGHCSIHAVLTNENPRVDGTIHVETESSVFWALAMFRYFYGAAEQLNYVEWTISLAIGGRVYSWCKFDYDQVQTVDECEVN